jgi:hypothetical protein
MVFQANLMTPCKSYRPAEPGSSKTKGLFRGTRVAVTYRHPYSVSVGEGVRGGIAWLLTAAAVSPGGRRRSDASRGRTLWSRVAGGCGSAVFRNTQILHHFLLSVQRTHGLRFAGPQRRLGLLLHIQPRAGPPSAAGAHWHPKPGPESNSDTAGADPDPDNDYPTGRNGRSRANGPPADGYSGAHANPGSGPHVGANPRIHAGADSRSDRRSDFHSDPEANANPNSEADADSATDSNADASSNSEADADSATDSSADTCSNCAPDADSAADSNANAGSHGRDQSGHRRHLLRGELRFRQ